MYVLVRSKLTYSNISSLKKETKYFTTYPLLSEVDQNYLPFQLYVVRAQNYLNFTLFFDVSWFKFDEL